MQSNADPLRFFEARTAESRTIVLSHDAARRRAHNEIAAYVADLARQVAAIAKADPDTVVAEARFSTTAFCPATALRSGRLAGFSVIARIRRNVLAGWRNKLSYGFSRRVSFVPDRETAKTLETSLPPLPSGTALGQAVGWELAEADGLLMREPSHWILGDSVGIALPTGPLFGENAACRRAALSWRPPEGFVEITAARYALIREDFRAQTDISTPGALEGASA